MRLNIYLWIEKGVTETLIVPRFGSEMTMDYDGVIVKIKLK